MKQIKKNAQEELVQGKKKRQTTEEKLSSAKNFTCKIYLTLVCTQLQWVLHIFSVIITLF